MFKCLHCGDDIGGIMTLMQKNDYESFNALVCQDMYE